VHLLANNASLDLLIAGRSRTKAEAFRQSLITLTTTRARLAAHVFDRDGDVAAQLAGLSPDLVVDATGPFQAYGDTPYRVVEAAIALGIDYLDLADASDFVAGIGVHDDAATTAQVFVLSGVSSFPVLTAAVVRRLSADMAQIKSVEGGVAPSPYAGVGLNVIKAIASYAGKPVKLVRHGKAQIGLGLVETRRRTICPPGRLPLKNTLFSLVDVPDLQALPALWPHLESIWMGAGPVPEILHRALICLSKLVSRRLIASLVPFAGLFHRVINVVRWGEHRGGMYVEITGETVEGVPCHRSWHLLAEGDHGPLIPSMAAEAIIRRCLSGNRPAAGARPGTTDLDLTDYEQLFETRGIYTGSWNHDLAPTDSPSNTGHPLYQRILGEAWEKLPAEIKHVHDFAVMSRMTGTADVERGDSLMSRLIAALFRFPAAGHQVPVSVTFRADGGRETWTRIFAKRQFKSVQVAGQRLYERLIVEQFGPFRFGLALVIDGAKLRLVTRRWSLFGCSLPSSWAPTGESFETVADDRFHFHVEIRHPLCGLIVKYAGWLGRSDRPFENDR
jgi:hypothetical protein